MEGAFRLFQLTWLSGKTYFYNVDNFTDSTMQHSPLKDGWGAATDGRYLIVSDGSANITWLDPSSLRKVKSVLVTDDGKPLPQLNEVRNNSACAIQCISGAWVHASKSDMPIIGLLGLDLQPFCCPQRHSLM